MTSRAEAFLEVRDLTCSRYDSLMIKDVSFSLGSGELLQIKGNNGSGKTTLIKTLCGLISPEKGDILWCGENTANDPYTYLSDLIYVGHQNGIKAGLTSIENLRAGTAFASELDTLDYYSTLKDHGLGGLEDSFVYSLSAGQKRRLALARLSLHAGRLWILDEPFTSLDSEGKSMMKDRFYAHLQKGGLILMTSHEDIGWDSIKPLTMSL